MCLMGGLLRSWFFGQRNHLGFRKDDRSGQPPRQQRINLQSSIQVSRRIVLNFDEAALRQASQWLPSKTGR